MDVLHFSKGDPRSNASLLDFFKSQRWRGARLKPYPKLVYDYVDILLVTMRLSVERLAWEW